MFDYECEDRPCYCDITGRNCPFDSQFRYCPCPEALIEAGLYVDPNEVINRSGGDK